jgi:ATP-dependent Lhr-like helicase
LTAGNGGLRSPVARDWFERTFAGKASPIQEQAWPLVAAGRHVLLISPTGTGKTLAAMLPVLDRLVCQPCDQPRKAKLHCVYISPLRSLAYDVQKNLEAAIGGMGTTVDVAVRTGDTSSSQRRKLRDKPPQILITTPESLALMLSQRVWSDHCRSVQSVVVDEIHELIPTKRGADLAISLERLSAVCSGDPQRIGLSATCRPADLVATFLGGVGRKVKIVEPPPDASQGNLELAVESLIRPDESHWRPLVYQRLVRRVRAALREHQTTLVFANTRALSEKLTHDLSRPPRGQGGTHTERAAAHHSALDAARRRAVEQQLKSGELRGVITSTSLELGIDIGSADLSIMIGPPPSVTRCLQRVGRSGHRVGAARRGLILAASPAEIIGSHAVVGLAERGELEPLKPLDAPLDVLCQQLVGMACTGEASADAAFALVRRSAPFAKLDRTDFDACLAFLAGQPGESDPNGCWTSPRVWKQGDLFGVRSRRVMRWLWSNIGTITSEPSVRVFANGGCLGTIEAAYADRLQPGDRFVLDGRSLQVAKLRAEVVDVEQVSGDPSVPRWTSDRLSMTPQVARRVGELRREIEQVICTRGDAAFHSWAQDRGLDPGAAASLVELVESQARVSVWPPHQGVLIEHHIAESGSVYTIHAPLGRAACEALARAMAGRLGPVMGRNVRMAVADLGWSIELPCEYVPSHDELAGLLSPHRLSDDVLAALEHGDLLPRQFHRVATTALMVLRHPEGNRTRVGGAHWVEQRLYPLLLSVCRDHPLLRETRRCVLQEVLDLPTAQQFLASKPTILMRMTDEASPYSRAWIDPAADEFMNFESPTQALQRLHERLCGATA